MDGVILDTDVAKVIDFMQHNMKARQLRAVAHAVAQIGDLIWAHFRDAEDFQPFRFYRRFPTVDVKDAQVNADRPSPQSPESKTAR
jgi:hypothetical protein